MAEEKQRLEISFNGEGKMNIGELQNSFTDVANEMSVPNKPVALKTLHIGKIPKYL